MDFRQVRYFLAVAEHANFRRAAEAVHVAQSALSKQIGELEAQLGVQLFDRLPSGVRLTQAGRVYAEEARRSLDLMERAATRARKAARGEIDRLTIAMNDLGTRNRKVAACVALFAQRFPEVQLDFVSMVSIEQLAALRFGKIDAGVLIERPHDGYFDHVPVERDPFWIALPNRHPLCTLDVVPVEALVAEPFVSVAMSTYWLPQTRLMARCRMLGLVPRVVQEASNDHMQMCFVAAGMGVAFVNASINAQLTDGVTLRPVAGLDTELELDFVWPRAAAAPSLQNFAATMRFVTAQERDQAQDGV